MLFGFILAIGKFLLAEVSTSIPLLVLVCKVLVNNLPARLSRGGFERIGFFCFCFLIYRFCFFHS